MSLKEVLKQLGIKLIGWVKSNCVNNLLSDRTDLPLSAAQGKADRCACRVSAGDGA